MGMLDGKVAIVTGAGLGIGRGEAMLLAREGAKVVVNDIGVELDGSGSDRSVAQKVVSEIKAAGGEAVANTDSVTDHQAAKKMIDQAIDAFGRFDVLVNNAGITRDKTIYNMDEDMFDAVIAVHLKGTFNTGKWACAYFREKGEGGRIINTTSAAGLVGNFGQTNYAAAKGGIAIMTLIWSREMDKYGVTVNAIAPAARTRMTITAFGDIEPDEDEEFDSMAPENVAPLVAYLASDAAEDVNGQIISISGGEIEIFEPWRPTESLSREERWTPAELAEAMKKFF